MKCTENTLEYCKTKIKYNKYTDNKSCDRCCIHCPESIGKKCDTICKIYKEQGEQSLIVYIAGKITGDKNYKEKFQKAEEYLTELGYTALNPAWLPSTGLEYEQYMRIGAAMLTEADAIYLLQDYKDSPGAIREINQAIKQNKKILR